ncbi:MAG: phosphomevalonate kinase [Sandaracinaceae bacterium]
MISGEYAVLEGGRALVAAVSRRARVALDPVDASVPPSTGSPCRDGGFPVGADHPPEVLRTRERAEQAFGRVPMDLSLDVSSLRDGERKLGLGSSAAASVATAAAVVAAQGRDVVSERLEILALALEGHRAVAPEGSGADVIASTLGGFVSVAKDAEGIDIEPLENAPSFVWRVVWTGSPARTSELVRAVRALATTDRARYERCIGAIDDASRAFIEAFEGDAVGEGIEAVRRHHAALRALGEAANVPIVTPALDLVAELARAEGGAAKPSGAGGGDVAVALFADDASALRFETRCRNAGLTPVPMRLGADGVRSEPAPLLS